MAVSLDAQPRNDVESGSDSIGLQPTVSGNSIQTVNEEPATSETNVEEASNIERVYVLERRGFCDRSTGMNGEEESMIRIPLSKLKHGKPEITMREEGSDDDKFDEGSDNDKFEV